MKFRVPFIAGAAIGYVLGTKAGRERYEQIMRASRRVAENPTVQETAGVLRAKSGELAGTAKGRATGLAGQAREKVSGRLEGTPLGDRIPGLRHEERHVDIPRPHSGTGATAPRP